MILQGQNPIGSALADFGGWALVFDEGKFQALAILLIFEAFMALIAEIPASGPSLATPRK